MPKSKPERVIRSFSLPKDMEIYLNALVTDQEKGFSAFIRGSLLQAWPEWFAHHLGPDRFDELIKEYHAKDAEGEP